MVLVTVCVSCDAGRVFDRVFGVLVIAILCLRMHSACLFRNLSVISHHIRVLTYNLSVQQYIRRVSSTAHLTLRFAMWVLTSPMWGVTFRKKRDKFTKMSVMFDLQ